MTGEELDALQHGDPVVWLHRPKGGYCQPVRVLATYLGSTAKRARIEVYREWPEPHAPWLIRKVVSAGYLRIPTPLETMRIESLAKRARTDEKHDSKEHSE